MWMHVRVPSSKGVGLITAGLVSRHLEKIKQRAPLIKDETTKTV